VTQALERPVRAAGSRHLPQRRIAIAHSLCRAANVAGMHRPAMHAAGESQLQDRASRPLAERPIAEAALAFVGGLATFALVSILVAAIAHDVPVLLLAIPLIGAIIIVARRWGAAYAVPVAMAGILAYDWYYLPPTHDHDFPDAANLAFIGVFLALGVLVGEIASRAAQRAWVSDVRRGELAEEQAALRRVATLVAQGVPPPDVFAAVARELGRVLDVDATHIGRYEPDGTSVVSLAGWSAGGDHLPLGTRLSLAGLSVSAVVARTGRPARVDDYGVEGEIAAQIRERNMRSSVGAPIVVDGRIWGVAVASSKRDEPLAADAEPRIAAFTELMATTISNAEARTEVERLADEQAALRRVATLVAEDAPQSQLFEAVGREAGMLLGADFAGMARFEGTDVIPVADWAAEGEHPRAPERWQMRPGDPATAVAEARRPVRWDDWASEPGPLATYIRDEVGARSTVGCPIIVEGRVWGAFAIHSKRPEPLPVDTESRLEQFAELVATAVANSDARREVERLADEQAALRRVATLVAQGMPSDALFSAVCDEVEALAGTDACVVVRFEADGTVTTMGTNANRHPVGARLELDPDYIVAEVHRTGRAARFDTDDPAAPGMPDLVRAERIRCGLASPIVVEGGLWGAITTASRERPVATGMERRLANFTELVATAIANIESQARAGRLAGEQAALRRVATLVAEEKSPAEMFAKVAEEAANVLEKVQCVLLRASGDASATVVAAQGADMSSRFPVGTHLPTGGEGVLASALREGSPQRIEYRSTGGATAEAARDLGISSAVASPIVAHKGIWGAFVAARFDGESCPPDTETRLAQFGDLVATALANADARAQVEQLANEQAALRRVAMLTAAGASPSAVFDAVAAEVEALLDADQVALNRFEPGDEIIVMAHRGLDVERTPTGSRVSIAGQSATATVRRTERPARMEGYESAEGTLAQLARDTGLRSSVSVPIRVERELWGLITASWKTDEPPPPETEERMVKFAALLDTAIANADSRDQLTASRARLVTAGDEARRRVVRDLHDGAQQRLVHTIVTLKLAQRALRLQDERAGTLIDEALQHAEQGNAELRELAHGILPAVLTHGGLRAGVDALVARLDLLVRVQVSSERLPAELEASAYFIVAEALTNVMKHAHADRADVTASVEDGVLRVEVRDDGVGSADPGGHGLVGIADRVSALGGQLRVDSPADCGTLVSATLPLPTDGAGSTSGR
jgi:signal transduction histidine kinase